MAVSVVDFLFALDGGGASGRSFSDGSLGYD